MYTVRTLLSIGIVLALIIGSSFFTNWLLSSHAQKLEEKIDVIETNTREKNWEEAEQVLTVVEEEWPRVEKTWAMLLDHIEIDNIDEALSKVSEYVKSKDTALALAELATLRQYIKHIPEKESFKLENIF